MENPKKIILLIGLMSFLISCLEKNHKTEDVKVDFEKIDSVSTKNYNFERIPVINDYDTTFCILDTLNSISEILDYILVEKADFEAFDKDIFYSEYFLFRRPKTFTVDSVLSEKFKDFSKHICEVCQWKYEHKDHQRFKPIDGLYVNEYIFRDQKSAIDFYFFMLKNRELMYFTRLFRSISLVENRVIYYYALVHYQDLVSYIDSNITHEKIHSIYGYSHGHKPSPKNINDLIDSLYLRN